MLCTCLIDKEGSLGELPIKNKNKSTEQYQSQAKKSITISNKNGSQTPYHDHEATRESQIKYEINDHKTTLNHKLKTKSKDGNRTQLKNTNEQQPKTPPRSR